MAERYIFHVEAQGAHDAFLRVLAPFVGTEAVVTSAQLTREDQGLAIRIEAMGLDARGAERLLLRAAAPVTSVGLGWRGT